VISTRKVQTEDGTLFLDMKCGNLMQQRITRYLPECIQRSIQIQGDQIGRIFTHWAIVYFGQFFETYKSSLSSQDCWPGVYLEV
jgi:hypothetical protein